MTYYYYKTISFSATLNYYVRWKIFMFKKITDKSRDILFMNPTFHIQSNKELYIENCKRIEEYNEVYMRLKSDGLYIQIWGCNLKAFDFRTNGLIIRGKIERIEFLEKR